MKKELIAIGVFGIVLMLFLSGCMEQKQEISKEKIMNAMKNVKSYTIEGNVETDMGMMKVSMPMNIKVDIANKKSKISTEVMGQKMEIYTVENTIYTKIGNMWVKTQINDSDMEGTYEFGNEVKCWKEMNVIGEEKIDNVDCYKLNVRIDDECFKNLNKNLLGTQGMMKTDSEEEISTKNAVYYIDKSTNLIKKHSAEMSIKTKAYGMSMEMNVKTEINFKDYDKTVVEELPEEARNAISMENETIANIENNVTVE